MEQEEPACDDGKKQLKQERDAVHRSTRGTGRAVSKKPESVEPRG